MIKIYEAHACHTTSTYTFAFVTLLTYVIHISLIIMKSYIIISQSLQHRPIRYERVYLTLHKVAYIHTFIAIWKLLSVVGLYIHIFFKLWLYLRAKWYHNIHCKSFTSFSVSHGWQYHDRKKRPKIDWSNLIDFLRAQLPEGPAVFLARFQLR